MIQRLLIANRGEIAIRIIRSCRELGVVSVAVYSDADVHAPHVAAADRAVRIGPASPAESYLSISTLIAAARSAGADALHPGYGFLSENPALAEACERAGLVFVGPPSAVIARMGSKIEARRLMASAGVPVVPGETPEDQSDAGLRTAVGRVGLPVLVKASAGGGGKGMRSIHEARDIDGAVQAARREAAAAFGDGTLYVERLIDRPRHIEVQIFGDNHGRIVHLFERECSAQRRHQKVIEESPSPALTPVVRARITDAAVRAAAAVGYRNAGTVEFLFERAGESGASDRFYFLEMNTRLQVEHPVTEAVTGLDLLRAQLLVASGEALPWTQEAVMSRGHAIEARVYAEDPARGFIPQAGRILLYREPRMPGVRVDSGIAEESEVPVHYDPLLAKVIASAESRELARERLVTALRAFPILGVRTNIPFLLGVLEHPRFRSGTIDTAFLDAEGGSIAESIPSAMPAFVVAAMAAADTDTSQPGADGLAPQTGWDPWVRLKDWRN
jgi:acetyl-CoA carboxylase biotin carboxylase subunit